jgi:hypothetical protein
MLEHRLSSITPSKFHTRPRRAPYGLNPIPKGNPSSFDILPINIFHETLTYL